MLAGCNICSLALALIAFSDMGSCDRTPLRGWTKLAPTTSRTVTLPFALMVVARHEYDRRKWFQEAKRRERETIPNTRGDRVKNAFLALPGGGSTPFFFTVHSNNSKNNDFAG